MSIRGENSDLRFHWFKHIIYKTLDIELNDPAFGELMVRDESAEDCLKKFIFESNKREICAFFYYTVEEEAVEVEDEGEQIEDIEKLESESSESEKLESEHVFADDKTEADDEVGSVLQKSDSAEASADSIRMSRRSTTSLLQVIKKNVLHFSFNLTKYTPYQRYVYFTKSKSEAVPVLDTFKEVFNTMLEFFEIGSINQHPLIAMRKLISRIYSPILEDENWLPVMPPHECEMDKNQFTSKLNEFHRNIQEFSKATEETVSHVEKPIMFHTPNIITSSSPEELAQEQSFVAEAEESVNEWIEVITELLKKSAQKKPPEDNLLGEILFWKREKLLWSTCYDHLSKSSVQQTTEILKIAESDLTEFDEKLKEVKSNMKTAVYNFNYLSLLKPLSKGFQSDRSFEDAKKVIEDIFLLLKMIWLQSNYYKEIPNMCRLIKGIANLLKETVKNNADVETLFRKNISDVKAIVNHSIQLLQLWKSQYLQECENVKKYGGSYWWGFEVSVFFTETDHIIYICTDLSKVTVMLEELNNIFSTNLKHFAQDRQGLRHLKIRVFSITSGIQYANFDIFDPVYKTEWIKVMATFLRDVHNFEEEIKLYIKTMFQSSLSFQNSYILTKSFEKIPISPGMRNFINESHDDMLKQFIKEIFEKENEFLSHKDEPPVFPNFPETASSIIWVQDLLIKLSQPISLICDRSDLTKKEYEVLNRFQRTEERLKEYKLQQYEIWKGTATEKLNKFLQANVLKCVSQDSSFKTTDPKHVLMYEVNFPLYLEDISVEAKLLEYFGFEIPTFVKNVVLQESLYYKHRHEIRITLEKVKRRLSTIKEDEISILGKPAENLRSVLDHGMNNIIWESSDIAVFVYKVKRAGAVFRKTINQIQNVFTQIDKCIDYLAKCDLFHFQTCDAEEIPTCEVFFEKAEVVMERKTENMVDLHKSLQLLLKNLEQQTCKTSSKESPQMRQYYERCEIKILASLLKMTLSNLRYFKAELLENYVFPYIELASQSQDEYVKSSLNRAELIFLNFIRTAAESTLKIIRWQDGTCIPSLLSPVADTSDQMEFSYYRDLSLHPYVKVIVVSIMESFVNFMSKIKQN